MRKLVAVLLVVIFAVTGCVRNSARESLPPAASETVRLSEGQACANVCLIRQQSCTDAGAEAGCAAESAQCVRSCAEEQDDRIYAFYCRAEIVAHRGLVMSDGSCAGTAGETLDEQQAGCERGFEPPSDAAAYTVSCTPVLTWTISGASGADARASRPAQGEN